MKDVEIMVITIGQVMVRFGESEENEVNVHIDV